MHEREGIRRKVGARSTGRRLGRTLVIGAFFGVVLTGLAQPNGDRRDLAACLQAPTVDCLTAEYRRLLQPVLARGESIGWENFQRLIALGEVDLARDAALALRVPPPSSALPAQELERRNNLQITRELALVAVMNAELARGDFAAAQQVLAATSGLGRIRGVIEYHAALVAAGHPGLDAYAAARANLDVVLRETFRDISARRWFGGAGYARIGEHLSIPCATAMARIGDIDHALGVAIAQNRAQATGLPNAIRSMARRLLEHSDTAAVRGLVDQMRRDPDRYHDLDHWTTVLVELADFETREGNFEQAREFYAQVVDGFVRHRQSPDQDQLLLALLSVEFVHAAPEEARQLVYQTQVLNPATRAEAEKRFATALKLNGDDDRLIQALRDIGPEHVAAREDNAVREAMAIALIRQNQTGEALELLRAGSSAPGRREAVELLLQQNALAEARGLLEPADWPGLAVRLLELERTEEAQGVLDACWARPEEELPLNGDLISATLRARGRSATETRIKSINVRARRNDAWVHLGNAFVDGGDIAAAQTAYREAGLTGEQMARVEQYFAAIRSGRPAATARYFATEAVRDDAGQYLPSNTRVYPPRVPGLKPLAFLRAITRIEFWHSLTEDDRRELLLLAAAGRQKTGPAVDPGASDN